MNQDNPYQQSTINDFKDTDSFVRCAVNRAMKDNTIDFYRLDDNRWMALVDRVVPYADTQFLRTEEIARIIFTPNKINYRPHTIIVHGGVAVTVSFKTHKWLVKTLSEYQIMQKLGND